MVSGMVRIWVHIIVLRMCYRQNPKPGKTRNARSALAKLRYNINLLQSYKNIKELFILQVVRPIKTFSITQKKKKIVLLVFTFAIIRQIYLKE